MATTKYQILAEALREEILSGKLANNDKLCTEKELMEQYSVSRQTVRHAISILVEEGYVRSRQGSGTFVLPRRRTIVNNSKQIALILTYISDYIFPSIIRGIESVLTQKGYTLLLKATGNSMDQERDILTGLLESPPCALIVDGNKTALPNPNLSYYRQLQAMGIPIIFIHATYPELTDIPKIAVSDKQGGHMAVDYLASKGHSKIAGIFKCTDFQGIQRFNGFLEGMMANHLSFSDKNLIWFQDNDQLQILLESKKSLRYFDDCTSVVCYNDQVASNVIQFLVHNGYRVPEDISVISFDDSSLAQYSHPNLTSFAHPKEKLGTVAANTIIQMIEGESATSTCFPWELSERDSVVTLVQE